VEVQVALVEYVKDSGKDQIEDEPPEDVDETVREYFDYVFEQYVISKTTAKSSKGAFFYGHPHARREI
jgi:hypothetical protein